VTQDFFECHEYLESLWLDTGRPEILQGLIQSAVCLYHLGNGNVRGALRMWQRARPRLISEYPDYQTVDLVDLVDSMDKMLAQIPKSIQNKTVTPKEIAKLDLPAVKIRFTDPQMDFKIRSWVPEPLPDRE